MKGIDVTGPPALPKHFHVKKGCMGDIYVGSEDESEDESEDDEEDELNNGRMDDFDSDNVGKDGDT